MSGYDNMKAKKGLHEARNRKELMNWFIETNAPKADGHTVDPSRVSWCATSVNACELMQGRPGTNSNLARSFQKLTYGEVVYDRAKKIGKISEIKKGDIVVFERGGSSWMGHVAYVDGVDVASDGSMLIRTLGGNQSDSVSIGWYPAARALTVRRVD